MTDTKYGDRVADHDWSTDDDQPDDEPAQTVVQQHKIRVLYRDDSASYGQRRYDAHIRYDDETGAPYVLCAVEYKWKGNYWRDTTDWDFRDVPDPVREQVAAVLPVVGPDGLNPPARVIDEGGESRWQKYHRDRAQAMDGDEMWGLSYLREAHSSLETAAEAFDDDSKPERLAETLVENVQKVVRAVDPDGITSESDEDADKAHDR